MNAHQRRKQARAVQRGFPVGTIVTRWYMPNTRMRVIGVAGRRVFTLDVESSAGKPAHRGTHAHDLTKEKDA